jgi:hypothetical protein
MCHDPVSRIPVLGSASSEQKKGGTVVVELTADGIRVHDADDCTRLSVATALAGADMDAALRSTGAGSRVDANRTDTVLLDIPTLREHARAAASVTDWDSRWQAMIAYAGRKGWITPEGTAVRAHLEPMS